MKTRNFLIAFFIMLTGFLYAQADTLLPGTGTAIDMTGGLSWMQLLGILTGVYEVVTRLVPTTSSWGVLRLVGNVLHFVDKIVPNRILNKKI